jgi:hypothetical protein
MATGTFSGLSRAARAAPAAVRRISVNRLAVPALRRISVNRLAVPAGLVLYASWATNVTWPLLASPQDSVFGGIGDQTAGIAHMREWIESGLFPFLPGTIEDFSAPEGLSLTWGVNLSAWGWTFPSWVIALVVGATASLALVTWTGIVLSGLTMQVLATRLTGSHAAGFVSGFAFAFYPYAIFKAAGHPHFAHGWPLALMAWRMLEVAEAPTRRNTVLAALAALVAIGFTPYYVLIGGVLFATCLVLAIVYGWRVGEFKQQLKAQMVIAACLATYVGVVYLATVSGGQNLRQHPQEYLTVYAARAHEYVVPFAHHRLFGEKTLPWLVTQQHGSNFSETTLYLGIVVLALALVATFAALRPETPPRLRWGWGAATVIALMGVVWSAPPHVDVLGVLAPFPSSFVGDITTTWRVYSRFVVDVMLGASLMAGVGVAALIRGRGPVAAGATAAVLVGAIAVDFYWRPGVTPLRETPPVYELLRERPGGILAQYPLLPTGFGDGAELLYQDAHGHPLLNGYPEGYAERRASTLYFVNRSRTARGLASLGVRYVLIPHDISPWAPSPDPGKPGRGFRLVGSGVYGSVTSSVYRVTAAPDLGYVYILGGAWADEGPPNDPFNWITAPRAELSVDAPLCKRPCRGHLRLRLSAFGWRREVTLRLKDGKVLWRGRVARRADVAVPLEVDGRAVITLTTVPGPVPVRRIDPRRADYRSLSVSVSRMRFTR